MERKDGLSPAIARQIAEAAEAAVRDTIAAAEQRIPYRTEPATDPFGLPPEEARARVARLTRAVRAERQLGIGGHWAYDLNRHIALAQQLRLAEAALAREGGGGWDDGEWGGEKRKAGSPSLGLRARRG